MFKKFFKTQFELSIIALIAALLSSILYTKKIFSFPEQYFVSFIIIQYYHYFDAACNFIGTWKSDSNGVYIPSKWYVQVAKILLTILYLPQLVLQYLFYKYVEPKLYYYFTYNRG